MRIIKLFFLLAALSCLMSGYYRDTKRPVDLPKLYPANVSITTDGKPLEGATVTLIAKTPSKYGVCSAETDASGLAVLMTYGYEGVPLGQYTVTVEKRGVEGAREIKTQEGITDFVGGKVYQYVDAQFADEKKTPLSTDVTEQGVNETFEVGKPVRIYLMDMAG